MSPIVPPASPIAVATRPSMPGRWSIRTRRVSENWAEVVGGTARLRLLPRLGVEGRAPVAQRVVARAERLVAGRGEVDVGDEQTWARARGGGPASSQPSGPAIAEPATQATPRSSPQRSQTATAIRFVEAATIARSTSIGRSPSGRGSRGQLVGTHSSSAPRSAAARTHSGNSRS